LRDHKNKLKDTLAPGNVTARSGSCLFLPFDGSCQSVF
jgi:hypothetical protein